MKLSEGAFYSDLTLSTHCVFETFADTFFYGELLKAEVTDLHLQQNDRSRKYEAIYESETPLLPDLRLHSIQIVSKNRRSRLEQTQIVF